MDAGSFNIKAALSGAPAAILRGTAGTASQCTASSYASSSYLPDEAWNGVKDGADGFNDVWRCNTVPNTDGSVYIQWEFGEAKNLTGFRFETRSNVFSGETSWPDDVKWLGKTSAQSWAEATTLYDGAISGASGLSPGDWCAWHDFTTTGDFDDYRMEIHSAYSYGASDGKPHIQEVEFSSVAVPAAGCIAYSGFFVADLEQAA